MSRLTGKEVTVTSLHVPRHLVTTAVLAATALMAAACGPSAPPAPAPTVTKTVTVTPTPTPTKSAGGGTSSPTPTESGSPGPGEPGACPTSALHLSIGTGNGAAGSVYYPLVFTNASSSPCTLFGFPGVSFVTGIGGSRIGHAATRNSDAPRKTVTLAPGGVAHATLQVVQALNFPPARCQLTTAHWLKVYPPNQTEPVFLNFTAKACQATAKDVTVLNVAPVRPGAVDS
ncbi:MAG TPA: DUF4232 domain-containing protein [Streptosporangiaceae bacterium]|jgi:Protein of unknown function (DUF4232)|nr:DUF4232 domain-containing protein [Streptosporangiaceae bacterium]